MIRPGHGWPCVRTLPCFLPRRCHWLPFAIRAIRAPVVIRPGGRRFRTPLLALIVVIDERSLGADDSAAAVAIGLETVVAYQRADPRRLQLDSVERMGARQLDVEFGSGMPVEQRHRALRGRVPLPVGRGRETADAAQELSNGSGERVGQPRPQHVLQAVQAYFHEIVVDTNDNVGLGTIDEKYLENFLSDLISETIGSFAQCAEQVDEDLGTYCGGSQS